MKQGFIYIYKRIAHNNFSLLNWIKILIKAVTNNKICFKYLPG